MSSSPLGESDSALRATVVRDHDLRIEEVAGGLAHGSTAGAACPQIGTTARAVGGSMGSWVDLMGWVDGRRRSFSLSAARWRARP